MRFKSNLHTHTTYCDGKATVEEMVAVAALKGYESIGFCEHAYVEFDKGFSMSVENTQKYIDEVLKIKKDFEGFMDIFLGCEYDLYSSNIDFSKLDYVVGAVHYAKTYDGFFCFDETERAIEINVKNYFDGDFYKYTNEYYRLICELADKIQFDVITHFDLVSKFNFKNKYFDESNKKYLFPALEAAEYLIQKGIVFEIDTGGMYKKCKTKPYPNMLILGAIKNFGGNVTIAADSHTINSIGFGFDKAIEYACDCGFKSILKFTKSGFEEVPITNNDFF